MPAPAADRLRRRFTRRTALALALVAGVAVAGHEGVRAALEHQVSNGRVVNLAGRQRMLSQRIAKDALAVRAGLDTEARLAALDSTVAEWQAVHRALLDGDPARGLPGLNAPHLRDPLDALTPTVERVGAAASGLRAAAAAGDTEGMDRRLHDLLGAEADFLPAMDRVVFALDAEAAADVRHARALSAGVLLLFLASLAAVAALVLRPAIRRVAEAVDQLDHQGRLLRTVIDTIPDHIYVKDLEGRATLRNLASARALGFDDPEAAVGRTDVEDSPALGGAALDDDLRVIQTGQPLRNKEERDGACGWLLTTKVPLRGADGEVTGLVGVSRDVTAAKEAEARVRATAERLAVLVRSLQAGALYADERGRVLIANARLGALLGLPGDPDAQVGRCGASVLAEAARQAADPAAFRSLTEACLRDRRPASGAGLALADGRVLDWEFVPVHLNGTYGGHLWLFRDVTERTEMEGRLYHQAHHDALTGVPNRALFTSRLEVAVARQREEEPPAYTLLYADLDGFKAVNDSLGHAVGDALLRVVAERIQGAVRPTDTVARLGGDEFAVLLSGVSDVAGAEAVVARVQAALAAPIRIEGHVLQVGASVGVVAVRPDHPDPDALLREADRAMYRVKRAQRRAAKAS